MADGQSGGSAARCPACGTNNDLAGAAFPAAPAPEAPFNPYQAPAVASAPILAPGVRPHRGGLVMTLGIISCGLAVVGLVICNLLELIALPMGIVALTMARKDLKAIAQGTMDRAGQGQTMAGLITGIIGTVLSSLGLLLVVALLVIYLVALGAAAGR
jgi:hypothetical protein